MIRGRVVVAALVGVVAGLGLTACGSSSANDTQAGPAAALRLGYFPNLTHATPIVGVARVADDDEAVRLMNDSPYGLTAAIWTRDQERALRIGAQIETGTFFMNRCDYLDPALPWTGVKDSGKGNSLSRYGFLSLTRRKSFHLRTQT